MFSYNDVATWLTSIGTVGTLAVALYQLSNERRYRRNKEEKVQAEKISAWIKQEKEDGAIHSVLNKSDEPVYQVIITVVSIQGVGYPREGIELHKDYSFSNFARCLSILPPGSFITDTGPLDYAMAVRFGIEIAFTDAGGRHWVRKSNGELKKLEITPLEYYSLDAPIDWRFPTIEF